MGQRTLVIFGLILTMCFGVSYAAAQHVHQPATHEGHRSQAQADVTGKDYALTADQRAKLRELRLRFKADTAEIKGKILTARLQREALWMNPNSDAKAILQKETELAELQKQMHEKRAQLRLEARKIYTPEQLAHFGMRGFGFDRGMHRHGRGMRHGAGGHRMHEGRGDGEHGSMEGGMHHGMGRGMMHGMGRGQGQGMGMMGKGKCM